MKKLAIAVSPSIGTLPTPVAIALVEAPYSHMIGEHLPASLVLEHVELFAADGNTSLVKDRLYQLIEVASRAHRVGERDMTMVIDISADPAVELDVGVYTKRLTVRKGAGKGDDSAVYRLQLLSQLKQLLTQRSEAGITFRNFPGRDQVKRALVETTARPPSQVDDADLQQRERVAITVALAISEVASEAGYLDSRTHAVLGALG